MTNFSDRRWNESANYLEILVKTTDSEVSKELIEIALDAIDFRLGVIPKDEKVCPTCQKELPARFPYCPFCGQHIEYRS